MSSLGMIGILGINSWLAIGVYSVVFVIVAFVFSAFDYEKLLRDKYKTQTMGMILYMIFTLCATFLIGTFLIVLVSLI